MWGVNDEVTHCRITVSIQEELASGTFKHASADALMMKSFTDSLMLSAFTSWSWEDRVRENSRIYNKLTPSRNVMYMTNLKWIEKWSHAASHRVELFPEVQNLVHVDIHRQVVMGNSLLRLHQPLSNHLIRKIRREAVRSEKGVIKKKWSWFYYNTSIKFAMLWS